MTNKEKLDAIRFFQTYDDGRLAVLWHELTCIESSHNTLVGRELNGVVRLECPDCKYTQNFIPPYVFDRFWAGVGCKRNRKTFCATGQF